MKLETVTSAKENSTGQDNKTKTKKTKKYTLYTMIFTLRKCKSSSSPARKFCRHGPETVIGRSGMEEREVEGDGM